ncbi:MAG: mechanosensitive ion channel [Muribaculaceae bacterium]|nr:mechanosensitive ion channel [Muribaculaceae bacterium]
MLTNRHIAIEMITTDPKDAISMMPQVDLSHPAAQGTYAIAHVLMKVVHWFLSLFHLEENTTLFTAIYAILVFIISIGVGYVVKWIMIFIVRKIGKRFHNAAYVALTDDHFFSKTARVFPAIVFLIFIQFTLNGRMTLSSWLTRLTWIYLSFVIVDSICILADVMWTRIDSRENKRKLPLKGLVQLLKGILWIFWVIITIAIILDKSPGALLAGLGAFAAVLMLVFKDSILGVVAGVQLSENDSLHVGDWIKVHGTDANGIVSEVSLTAVKVRNWDKTTTTLPPYSLVSGGFTNYNTMQLSNTRRIQRSYMIDADSVVPCDEVLLKEFSQITILKEWIEKKIEQKKQGKVQDAGNPEGLADGSIDTNLGVFRAYMKIWLDQNANIAKDDPSDTCFVRTLPQTPNGIPLEIYCFTSTSVWATYEAIQSSVFEHIAMMLFRFHLYTYESPSGRDTIIDGYMCPGKDPATLFGIPYPFFNGSGTPETPGIMPAVDPYARQSQKEPIAEPVEPVHPS